MKKLLSVLMVILLLVSITACRRPPDDPVENPDPIIPSTQQSTEPTDVAEQETTEATEPALTPTGPGESTVEDLNLIIYDGVYCMEDATLEPGQSHVVEVCSYGNFLTLEHGLYQDGSLYAFWVEEFWPDENEVFTDLYDARNGKLQGFSVQTADTQYYEGPQSAVIRYNDAGIAIQRGDAEDMEFYILDSTVASIHQDEAEMVQQLQQQEPITLEEDLVGIWRYWTEDAYITISFGQDGQLHWINKSAGLPVEIYKGAWGINETGTITLFAERLGCGTMPYVTQIVWEYEKENSALILMEQMGPFLYNNNGYACVYNGAQEDAVLMTQSKALAYVKENWGIQGYYQPNGAEEVYYAYDMPWFLGDDEVVAAINEEIRQMFGKQIEQAFADMEAGNPLACNEVTWNQYLMEDVLALEIRSYGLQEQVMIYYYDTVTNTRFYPSEVMQRLGIDQQCYLDSLTAAVQESFDSYHFELSETERAELGYESCRAWTMSADNINLDRGFVVNEFGEVITYVVIETVYGAYWEAVYPFGMVTSESVG